VFKFFTKSTTKRHKSVTIKAQLPAEHHKVFRPYDVTTPTQYYDKVSHKFFTRDDNGQLVPMPENPVVAAMRQ